MSRRLVLAAIALFAIGTLGAWLVIPDGSQLRENVIGVLGQMTGQAVTVDDASVDCCFPLRLTATGVAFTVSYTHLTLPTMELV